MQTAEIREPRTFLSGGAHAIYSFPYTFFLPPPLPKMWTSVKAARICALTDRRVWTSTAHISVWTPIAAETPMCRFLTSESCLQTHRCAHAKHNALTCREVSDLTNNSHRLRQHNYMEWNECRCRCYLTLTCTLSKSSPSVSAFLTSLSNWIVSCFPILHPVTRFPQLTVFQSLTKIGWSVKLGAVAGCEVNFSRSIFFASLDQIFWEFSQCVINLAFSSLVLTGDVWLGMKPFSTPVGYST